LKSSSGNIGALTLAAICRELESMGRAGVIEGAAEKVARVEAEYAKVCMALSAVRRKGEKA
ncbi:MAG: Hpt domain-containing protein, partial [Bacillota bacterium]